MPDTQKQMIEYDPSRLEKVGRDLDLRLLVLFGSRATGSPTPSVESDLDLAILPGKSEYPFSDYYGKLAQIFRKYTLDIAFLQNADPLFRFEVMENAILLYGNIDYFYEYKVFAYKDFIDSQDLRNLEEALFQKKLAHIRQQISATDEIG